MLDLLRRLHRRGHPGSAPQPRRRTERGRPRVGLGLACKPPHPLQPRLRRPDGKPWSERKALVWWDPKEGKWTGHDVPDFAEDKKPSYEPSAGARAAAAVGGADPFIMPTDRPGRLSLPSGLTDRPVPAHHHP